jgi:hypothetical protein
MLPFKLIELTALVADWAATFAELPSLSPSESTAVLVGATYFGATDDTTDDIAETELIVTSFETSLNIIVEHSRSSLQSVS